jgi:hypothetical protein
MGKFRGSQHIFERFKRAAAKGHEESIWISSVVKEVAMEAKAWKEAFAKTEEPLGWYFAGELSDGTSREQFDFWKKSAEGGCSWGQVGYGDYFRYGWNVEKDQKAYLEWLEKAASQNNPEAIHWLGYWFRHGGNDKEKAVSYYRAGVDLGWKGSMDSLARMLMEGDGCAKDLRQAVLWSVRANVRVFWKLLGQAGGALELNLTEDLDCNFNELCFSLGWGLYWYEYNGSYWKWDSRNEDKIFGNGCLDFYCATIQLQRESIFTFLLFWNRAVGVKDVGTLIGKMVWEEDRSVWVKRLWKN